MKGKRIFILMCVGLMAISSVVCNASPLSLQEMKQITGKCGCEVYYEDPLCVYWGDLDCVTYGGCPYQQMFYYDNMMRYIRDADNDLAKGWEIKNCKRLRGTSSGEAIPEYICYSGEPDGYNEYGYSGYFFSCQYTGNGTQHCQQCTWNDNHWGSTLYRIETGYCYYPY